MVAPSIALRLGFSYDLLEARDAGPRVAQLCGCIAWWLPSDAKMNLFTFHCFFVHCFLFSLDPYFPSLVVRPWNFRAF